MRSGEIMVGFEVAAVLLAGTVVAAYFERASLKADVKTAEAKVLSVANKLINELLTKETVIRTKISADVAKVIADAKAEAARVTAFVKNAATGAETPLEAVIEKIEADLKKVL